MYGEENLKSYLCKIGKHRKILKKIIQHFSKLHDYFARYYIVSEGFFALFCFLRQGFSVALEPVLELAL